MSQNDWKAQFQVNGRIFTLSIRQQEFNLQLKREFRQSARKHGMNAWLAFADEPALEDVNQGIDAFAVMQHAREHISRYVHKYQPAYFCFHASTERKARIYPRFAQRLLQDLPHYSLNHASGSFYFYKQN